MNLAPAPKMRAGLSWWARQWLEALESAGQAGRLQRGRSYARAGQVRSMEIEPGRVTARVKGSRSQPYTVRMDLALLSDEAWERAADALASQARYSAMLLSGEMPRNIEAIFRGIGAHLFPQAGEDFSTHCSCPDEVNPCKHIAAVHYVLGAELDRHPFLLFRLRGRTREVFLGALRARRAALASDGAETSAGPQDVPESNDVPLEDQIDRFWTLGEGFESLRFSIEAPPVAGTVLKRLGSPVQPGADEKPGADLTRVYSLISERAIRTAYDD